MAEKPLTGYEYEQYAPEGAYKHPRGSGSVKVAVVESRIKNDGNILPINRHLEASTNAARLGAENAFSNHTQAEHLPDVFASGDDVYADRTDDQKKYARKTLGDNRITAADVISLSYRPNTPASSDIKLDGVKGIIVHAEGNSGTQPEDVQNDMYNTFKSEHCTIGVGAATRESDGYFAVADYSNKSGPTLLTLSPYSPKGHGHTYRYVLSEEDVHQAVVTKYKPRIKESIRTHIIQRHAQAELQTEEGRNGIIDKDVEKARVVELENKYKNDETYRRLVDEELHKEHSGLDEYYTNLSKTIRVVRGWDGARQNVATDAEGYAHDISGTSFTAPWVAGQIGAQKQLHPSLSNEELVAALTASTTPIRIIENSNTTVDHITTATGRSFDPVYSGFGVLDEAQFAKNATLIEDIKKNNPNLPSSEMTISGASTADTSIASDDTRTFKVLLTSDVKHATAINTDVEIKGAFTEAPTKIFLISPSGTRMPVAISRDGNTIRANTDGFLGEQGDGEWKVEGPNQSEIVHIKLRAVERGGVIDRFLEQAPVNQIQEAKEITPEAKEIKPEAKPEPPPAEPEPLQKPEAAEARPELAKLLLDAELPEISIHPGPTVEDGTLDLPPATIGMNPLNTPQTGKTV